ncbi:asparagine synthase (glutamine-hydrolyzing) [Christiangramia fulva]|uniref:asparagine synthase (glutamine-hydrolyzing) n=1 Tax=Christiangramia fulva TaxID=2126553 RepID=A0A2R3Z9N7_9FLAO|nr:asparagine synthase (glutamine-hydrolyzing) [Christiangramia fulva]AVR46894.1 asparagine synthase (glutamine-hydrolyzing) [Christiangramia fulva]
MCGINGVLTLNSSRSVRSILADMNQKIIHRGPDEDGFFENENSSFRIGMAMRRLSIIDLATGKQPFYSEDGKIALVFNGEIYNFQKLRRQLEAKGVVFNTTSDTEVILRLYEKYGTDSFRMLDGMFAFSIYDDNLKKIFIARDFFGEKPLYYTRNGNSFFWASELKSIVPHLENKPSISVEGLDLFFRLTYIPAPFSIYENIFKLEANSYLEINCEDLSFSLNKIVKEEHIEKDSQISYEEAKKKTYDLVNESVESRSYADVPLGTFLSGGVDSSIVSLALAQQKDYRIDTFSIGFEKKSFDESDKARTVAKLINSKHHEFIISIKDLRDNIDSILLNFDEPFADSSSLPTYLVAHKTRQFVKVALTGDGGDEVFGGYNKYYMGKMNRKYTSVIPEQGHEVLSSVLNPLLSSKDDKRGLRFKVKKTLASVNYDGNFYFNIISLANQAQELRELLRPKYYNGNIWSHWKKIFPSRIETLGDFRLVDKHISLEGDMLVKVDRTSMLTSLESRAPFLNKKLWDYTNSLPDDYLMKGWDKKHILKDAYRKEFPDKFLDKSKKGFGVPVGDWLREHLSAELKSYSNYDFLEKQGIFNTTRVNTLVERHLNSKEDNTFKVWAFYCFQKWYKNTFLSI